jgi:hypothetical protein
MNEVKKIERKCAVCGRTLTITIFPDGTYKGGHYFGKINGIEYWECNECFSTE